MTEDDITGYIDNVKWFASWFPNVQHMTFSLMDNDLKGLSCMARLQHLGIYVATDFVSAELVHLSRLT